MKYRETRNHPLSSNGKNYLFFLLYVIFGEDDQKNRYRRGVIILGVSVLIILLFSKYVTGLNTISENPQYTYPENSPSIQKRGRILEIFNFPYGDAVQIGVLLLIAGIQIYRAYQDYYGRSIPNRRKMLHLLITTLLVMLPALLISIIYYIDSW